MRTVVVVGGGAAGSTAASRAKRLCPNCRVVLVEAGDVITHAPCAVPYAIGDMAEEAVWLFDKEEFEAERGVEVLLRTRAVDVEGNRVKLEGERGGFVEFDALIIATGARPWIPPVEGVGLKGVVVPTVANIRQAKAILAEARRVSIVGGGYIGVEMADVLAAAGKRVVLIEGEDRPLPKVLDRDVAGLLANYMASGGVELRLGERVVRLEGGDRVRRVVTDGGRYEVDAVVFATGVRPNVELALKAGAKLGPTGAVAVNRYLEAGPSGVYVAGDAAEMVHKVTGEPAWIPLATYANKMGYVAGTNAGLGGRAAEFPPVAGASVTKFRDMYVGSVGLTEADAARRGMAVAAYVVRALDRAKYVREVREMAVKALVSGGRLIGMQIVGFSSAVGAYVDLAAQFIGEPAERLFYAEYSYMPFTAPVWHPFVIVGRLWLRNYYRPNGSAAL
ncbi:MAG: FAD-dependent oxidoreductase [Thermoproteus sp.]